MSGVQEFSQAVEVFAALCGRRTTLEQDIVRQAIVGVLKAAPQADMEGAADGR